MLNMARNALMKIVPAMVGCEEELSPQELEEIIGEIELFLSAGAPEFRFIYYGVLVLADLLPLAVKGKTLHSLEKEEMADFLNRLYASRSALLRGLAILLGAPIQISFYNREEESRRLGFDRRELKEEAEKRVVTRDRD